MKAQSEIEDRIRHLLQQELSRRLDEAQQKIPRNCTHNHRHPLDIRQQVDGEPNGGYNRITVDGKRGLPVLQTIGLCMYGSEDTTSWNGTICEDPMDAVACGTFDPILTEEAIKTTIEAQLKDIDWVRENLPEVHSLLWVIGLEKIQDVPAALPQPPAALVTGWRRWFLRLLGISPRTPFLLGE